jgi:phospholipid/cholesterol/gamma-HCH transport system permease protein
MKTIVALGDFGYLMWRVAASLRFVWFDRRRLVFQLDHMGVRSVPLVGLIGFFAGAIVAWQGAYQLKGMISLSILGGQVVRVLVMEMGPVLTALVMSGRIGASMAAEIGTMKVTEQIDALRTMSIDPVRYIVLPRFMAMVLMMPVLTILATTVAVIGSFLVSNYFLGVTQQVYFQSVRDLFQPQDLIGGLIKGMVFGIIIALVSCYRGLHTQLGASGVGAATISAFVICAVSVLAVDFLLWIILF